MKSFGVQCRCSALGQGHDIAVETANLRKLVLPLGEVQTPYPLSLTSLAGASGEAFCYAGKALNSHDFVIQM